MDDRRYILNFTPTGMIPTREMTPHVPITPDEIVEQVCEAAEMGVNMVHLHARDLDTGEPAYQKDLYAEMIAGIREHHPALVLGVSTSGRKFPEFEKRADVLRLDGDVKPDFASLTLSSLNFNKEASVNTPEMIQALAREMLDRGIRPELEAFDLGMINYARYLDRKKLLPRPLCFNLILGNIACAQANALNLGLMCRELWDHAVWSGGGVGDHQLKVNILSLLEGGGVRVGLEDNIWFDTERTRLATNRDLVERVLLIAGTMGRTPYTHTEARAVLGV